MLVYAKVAQFPIAVNQGNKYAVILKGLHESVMPILAVDLYRDFWHKKLFILRFVHKIIWTVVIKK